MHLNTDKNCCIHSWVHKLQRGPPLFGPRPVTFIHQVWICWFTPSHQSNTRDYCPPSRNRPRLPASHTPATSWNDSTFTSCFAPLNLLPRRLFVIRTARIHKNPSVFNAPPLRHINIHLTAQCSSARSSPRPTLDNPVLCCILKRYSSPWMTMSFLLLGGLGSLFSFF